MGSGIYIALSGARIQSDAMDTAANNVANAGTNAYKAERMSFAESLARFQSPDSRFVTMDGRAMDETAGPIEETDDPLDMALMGDGYFTIQTDEGLRYTRDGSFMIDDDGQLVTANGNAVVAEGGGTITMPPDAIDIEVDVDGTIYGDGEELGRLQLARFAADGMRRMGSNMFQATGRPIEGDPPQVRSGALELSNVNAVRSMVSMVQVSRVYEAMMKMIETYSSIESKTAREIGNS